MSWKRIAVSAALVAALAASPFSGARAQQPCPVFPLCLPFVAVGAAAMVVTAPFRAFAPPYYPPGYAYPPGYYYPPAPGYYGYYGSPYYSPFHEPGR